MEIPVAYNSTEPVCLRITSLSFTNKPNLAFFKLNYQVAMCEKSSFYLAIKSNTADKDKQCREIHFQIAHLLLANIQLNVMAFRVSDFRH